MADLLLEDGDIVFDAAGRLQLADDTGQIAGRIVAMLDTLQGTYPYNLDAGFPWFEEVLGRFTLDEVQTVLKAGIAAVDGVQEILEFTATIDPATRMLDVEFSALLETDEAVQVQLTQTNSPQADALWVVTQRR